MRALLITAAIFALPAIYGPAYAGSELAETEAARANARAGRPLTDREAELLERYGCLSGSQDPVCRGRHQRFEDENVGFPFFRVFHRHHRRHSY